MNKLKSMFSILMAFVLLAGWPTAIHAEETPESGSLVLTLTDDEDQPVVGGTITLTKVADFSEEDGNLTWKLLEAIDPQRNAVEAPQNRKTINEIKEAIKDADLENITVNVNQEGKAVFENLPLGLYLVTQQEPAETYNPITSFLIGLPEIDENGNRNYNLEALPKVEIRRPRKPNTGTQTNLPFYIGLLMTSLVLLVMALKLKKSPKTRI